MGRERPSLERLKWRSRRGLLELDLIFDRFWKTMGDRLDDADAAALERLLQLPDNDLLDLLMGRAQAADEQLRGVVHKLRSQ